MWNPKSLFNNVVKPIYLQSRGLIKKKISPGGIQYYGFKYHPRYPDFKDPPYEPSKLFLVIRHKPVVGTNPAERNSLQRLNLDGHIKTQGHIAILKNIPEVNKYLWKIKHLVEIIPIKFLNGLPKDGDYTGTWLRKNGEFTVSHKLKVPQDRLQATEEYHNSDIKFNSKIIKAYLRDKWNNPLDGGVQ